MRVPINPPEYITQGFGTPEVGSAFGLHSGIDYAAPTGTPVYACISGTISIVKNDEYHGNVVDIHNGKNWYRVMHLSKFKKTSGSVKEGDLIGFAGSTGFSTGPHVHWDVRTQFVPTSFKAFINPLSLLSKEQTVNPTHDEVVAYFRKYVGAEPTKDQVKAYTSSPWRRMLNDLLNFNHKELLAERKK